MAQQQSPAAKPARPARCHTPRQSSGPVLVLRGRLQWPHSGHWKTHSGHTVATGENCMIEKSLKGYSSPELSFGVFHKSVFFTSGHCVATVWPMCGHCTFSSGHCVATVLPNTFCKRKERFANRCSTVDNGCEVTDRSQVAILGHPSCDIFFDLTLRDFMMGKRSLGYRGHWNAHADFS